jgi:hypothetical protein
MSDYSDDDVRRAAEVREWLIKQITDKQEEVDRLRMTLSIIDGLLKQGSFRAAASLGSFTSAGASATTQVQQARNSQAATSSSPPSSVSPSIATARRQAGAATTPSSSVLKSSDDINKDIRQLKRAKDDMLLASAEVSQNAVVILPAAGVILNANTPPFKSFFLNRILEGMKNKDTEKVNQGVLQNSDMLNYKIDEDNGQIKRITITNYREKERLQEIFNTSSWVFTRMLEKSGSGGSSNSSR